MKTRHVDRKSRARSRARWTGHVELVTTWDKIKKGKNKDGNDQSSDIYKIVKMIMLKNYNPVIVFAFSKRECENLALQMSKLEFNTDDEKDMVATVFNNAIGALSEEDQKLV